MTKTYRGSCHCGAVRFEAELDLQGETSRCNCSMCMKTRLWKVFTHPDSVRVEGEDRLTDYRFGSCVIRHRFCAACGVKMFGEGEVGGQAFMAISVPTLDDVTDEELAAAPVVYQDGRHDAQGQAPAVTGYL